MADATAGPVAQDSPGREPAIRQYPRASIRYTEPVLDADKLLLSYDRPSDTLLIFFHGRERQAVAVGASDYTFLLVDPATNELVGLQIEDVLARAVRDEPRLLDLLDCAELRGITRDDLGRMRRSGFGSGDRFHTRAKREVQPRRSHHDHTQELVMSLLRDERLGLPSPQSSGVA